ncbi:ABC transporter ATP-binding protein [Staphylococcus americanisciuri]|uniref:ATP-binding cassette domain-containing protein n=1 Tax=Staphylococcus americanisciuri TaxID=2973940 RepID=A0ABT2F2I8_9STAP|nr:ATP-binding cassette domain-containing protein [Staphylococcus americanisciuri]MCS4486661.1 ATP-binding cassette domain-containing protein [Staphylococcus americanisciuri]
MLELKNVGYCIDDKRVIDAISLSVARGEAIAVTGPSGSGKSTLLRMIGDLISPTEGEIYFKGKRYDAYKPEALRLQVSYLSQSIELFGETIADNLAFPSIVRKDTFNQEQAKTLMAKVGLHQYHLSDSIHRMSGGEKQRVTIARQLMYRPDVLLLDEATSALDDENSVRIEKIIFDIVKKGTAVLWITHNDAQSHRYFDRRIVIKNGRLVEECDKS